MMPLSQLASISAPEPRMITVQVWDVSNVKAVEKGITNAGLGLNPSTEGQLIRLPIPALSEERRKELAKLAGKFTEQTRVAIRNIRRDGMDSTKKEEKDGASKDDVAKKSDQIQKLTDEYIKKADDALKAKEEEIMKV